VPRLHCPGFEKRVFADFQDLNNKKEAAKMRPLFNAAQEGYGALGKAD